MSQMNRILANTHLGVHYPGKHETLVDDETWQRVQDVLAAKRIGEKHRTHHHYLKGTIFCGHCHSRLCVTYARGKLGVIYPYWCCVGRC